MDSTATIAARKLGKRAATALTETVIHDRPYVWGSLTTISGLMKAGLVHSPLYQYTGKVQSRAELTPRGREIAAARIALDAQP